jgi:hypothetical protein
LVFCFSWFSFFAFWGAEKHVFHISPFRPTSYILTCFRCLENSNRVKNWYKYKKLIFVVFELQLCQFEITIFMYKVMCLIILWISVSYEYCVFNRVSRWNKSKSIIKLRSWFQISQEEILFSYSKSTIVNVNMSFLL